VEAQDIQLLDAIWHNNVDRVVQLLADGASPDCVDNAEGATPLLIAVQREHVHLIALLVEAGADLSVGSILRSGTPRAREPYQRRSPELQDSMRPRLIELWCAGFRPRVGVVEDGPLPADASGHLRVRGVHPHVRGQGGGAEADGPPWHDGAHGCGVHGAGGRGGGSARLRGRPAAGSPLRE
jgi:hypothetical protein